MSLISLTSPLTVVPFWDGLCSHLAVSICVG
jgi:hypothetical protein